MSCLLQLSSARGRDGENTRATGSGEPTRGPARVASAPPSGWVDSYPWPSWKGDGGGAWANYSPRPSPGQEGGAESDPARISSDIPGLDTPTRFPHESDPSSCCKRVTDLGVR